MQQQNLIENAKFIKKDELKKVKCMAQANHLAELAEQVKGKEAKITSG